MNEKRSLVKSLFDFKLENFVAQRVLKFLYAALTIIISAAVVIGSLVSLIGSSSDGLTLLMLPVILILGFIYLLLIRVWFEYLIVFFRIHENTEKMVAKE